jgi:hypothetical protein
MVSVHNEVLANEEQMIAEIREFQDQTKQEISEALAQVQNLHQTALGIMGQ